MELTRRSAFRLDAPGYQIRLDLDAALCHVRFLGRITGGEMIEAVRAITNAYDAGPPLDMIWDCSGVNAHIVAPDEFQEILTLTLDHLRGYHAILYSRVEREDIISDLFAQRLIRCGLSASTHLTVPGALLVLERESLPETLL